MNPKDLAGFLSKAFGTVTRDDKSTYVRLKDGSPDWMQDVIREAHDSARMLPDDHRYAMIRDVTTVLDEEDDWDDLTEALDALVDHTYHLLAQWLASNNSRFGYCDDAINDAGPAESISDLLMRGQYAEYQEIADQLRRALEETAETFVEEEA